MPERSTVVQTIQVAPEAALGTALAATKKLQTVTLDFSGEGNVDTFRPSGNKYATFAALGEEWSSARLSGRATYTELAYLLAANVTAPVIVQAGAGPLAWKWTYTPLAGSEDSPKSFTLEQGSAMRAQRYAGLLLPDFGYTLTRKSFELTGRAFAGAIEDNHALTAGCTPLALVPILPKQVKVYADPTAATIGTTKLARCLRVEWANNGRFNPHWVLDSDSASYVAAVEAEPATSLRLVMQANAVGMGYLTQMRAGDKVFIQIKATGGIIEGAVPYSFTHNVCGIISEPFKFQDEEGVWCVAWNFRVADDDTLTYPYKIEMVNKLAALD